MVGWCIPAREGLGLTAASGQVRLLLVRLVGEAYRDVGRLACQAASRGYHREA